jgi:hypothetical protein
MRHHYGASGYVKPKKSRKGLREVPWGLTGDPEEICIYDNGHIDPAEFLARVRAWDASDIAQADRDALTVDDVRHVRFCPMSPTEARQRGLDYGVIQTLDGGYPVTVVILC